MKRFRLTKMQEAMLFEALDSSDSRYVTVLRYELEEGIDAGTLRRRMDLLAERHEALRTSFTRDDEGNLWQEVADRVHIDVSIANAYTDEEVRIDPFNGKLFRLILCGKELTVIFHHALFDGWSISVLIRELLAENAPEGKASPFRYYVKWLGQRSYVDDLNWWKRYLDGADMPSGLPGATDMAGYERRELSFKLEYSKLLRQRATELCITAGRLIQAVWCMLIARYNEGRSVVCGVNSGRSVPVPGITEMVGMCVNTLPVVTKLPKPPDSVTFADWISEWSRQAAEAERHGFCHVSDIIKSPMSHILAIEPAFDGDGYTLKSSSARLVTDFDAVFTLSGEIKAEFAYNSYVYPDEAVTAIKGHFITALNAVLENPRIALEAIPILTDAEISELTAFNENKEILDIIEHKTIVRFWSESAVKHSNRTAIVCGDLRLTYAELADMAGKISSALISRGVGAEKPVAIKLNRSERYVIAELSVIMAGGFFIPLDPEWPEDRIQAILTETKPFMVMDEAIYAELSADKNMAPLKANPKPRDSAYMIMTSGTTGIPKGVVIEHRSIANFCLWAARHYGWQAGDSCAMVLGFGFDGSMWDIWLPLISGGTLHILNDGVRLSISALGEYCRTEHITHIDLPVIMADNFREIYSDGNALPDLRVMVIGGEEVRRVVPAPYPMSNEYGPTECTVCCSAGWINSEDKPISIGSPLPNTHAYILDEWGRLCPDGVVGEACFSGVQVARGYYNSPNLTAERFATNPFSNGNENHNTLYRSGDLMYRRRHGTVREFIFKGRADSQVKINGYRIELGEIESILALHPSVNAATVAVRENRAGEKIICAYLVPKDGLDIAELKMSFASKLPSFMRPSIAVIKHIPLNASGKVDYDSLPLIEAETVTEYAKPETESEKALISAVSRALNVSNIGKLHNYLELGGNSINAMRVAFRLEHEGYELTAKEIIASVNLAELATRMRPAVHGVTAGYSKETFIPLSAQQAMIFLAETEGSASYTITLRLDAPGLGTDELRRRLDRAAKLHDILRASFELGDEGRIIGRIHDIRQIPLRVGNVPLSGGINPLRDPLLDLTLCGEELIIRYHHIALDGWSVNLLIDEILFNKFPESAPSFAQFANRHAAQTKRRVDDEAWWRNNCKHARIVPLIPPKAAENPDFKRVIACPPELLAQCVEAARKMHVTAAAFTLAAWGTVLRVLGAEDGDILIPFVASSRDDDTLMGMCAATHPLRFDNVGETFGDLSRKVQDTMLESIRRLFVPQDIIGKLPGYLFVFEDDENSPGLDASGEQNYDLVLKFADRGEIIYNASRISEELAHTVAARLEAALKAAVNNRISIFYEGEYELVTKNFAQGRKLDLKYQRLADAFIAAANTYAGRIALEAEDCVLTYAELYNRAKKLADILDSHGIGPGDIVAFNLPRSAEGIIAPIGIALSGAAFLPLDPAWPQERIQDILNDSGARAVIRCGMNVEITGVRRNVPADTAYLLYTSGTTGRPKAVMVPQRALINQIAWGIDEFGFNINDKILHYIAFTFDPSVWVLFTSLSSGATLSLLPECLRLDFDATARYIAEKSITACVFPAAVCANIMRCVGSNSSLRMVFLGGEAPNNLPKRTDGVEAVNLYGPTEACVNTAFHRMPRLETATRNIGSPVANTSCYVLDACGKPCPVGIQGELCIGGVQLAHGYLNRDEENAAAFVENPLFGRLYRTGDLAVWKADGTLEFLGRNDRQVKIRGNRVEIEEIENVLCDIPEISDAKVRFAGDALDAYVILHKDAPPLDAPEIRRKLSQRLPAYMLPRGITALDAFPLTENGKVDFAALSNTVDAAVTESAEPLSEMEKNIAAAWKSALSLDDDFKIGRNANFFDLGGHSLLLFGVVGLLAASGISADIRTLIEHPVLADLASVIGSQKYAPVSKEDSSSVTSTDEYRLYMCEMEKIDLTVKRPMHNVLITGGTGFLGSHLINEIFKNTEAKIYLPVRGGVDRIKESLSYYFGERGGEMAASKRLHVYLADISGEESRCDAHLDAIFHTAADIRHYAPEPEMYKANVTATENMLQLAERQPDALFAHISTTSAVNVPFIRENDTGLGPDFNNVYQRTKQLAERRVLDAGKHGLKYAIFRIGHVSPGFEKGSVARNWEINAMLRLINAMLLTGLLPEQDYKIGYGYADKTARAIMLLSQSLNLEGKILHIDNPHSLRLSELFKLAGLTGKIVSRNELISELRRLTASDDVVVRQTAAEYLGRVSQGDMEKGDSDIVAGKLSMDATLILLERLGFKWPHVTEEYMKNVIRSLNNKGGAI